MVVDKVLTPRPDMFDKPMDNAELVLYVDGSLSRAWDGSLNSGYAVCTDSETFESGKLSPQCTAQQAEFCFDKGMLFVRRQGRKYSH